MNVKDQTCQCPVKVENENGVFVILTNVKYVNMSCFFLFIYILLQWTTLKNTTVFLSNSLPVTDPFSAIKSMAHNINGRISLIKAG